MTKILHLSKELNNGIPIPKKLKQSIPLQQIETDFVLQSRKTIENILTFKDQRLLVIVGPCSIHDTIQFLEYATKLQELSARVSDSLFVVIRAYFEKPRTSLGWKGYLYDPHLDGSNDIYEGLHLTRTLLKNLAALKIPAACEFLEPFGYEYFGDLISWACIGARTSSSQIHRQLASSLTMPVGLKNATCGSIDIAIHGILSAIHPHTFMGINQDGQISLKQTKGNPFAHIVLRGGEHSPNYDFQSIQTTINKLKSHALSTSLLIDCSHDNSSRIPYEQVVVFEKVLNHFFQQTKHIRGFLIESHLLEGNQQINTHDKLKYGVSVTDPCLDWKRTEDLLLWAHETIRHSQTKDAEPCLITK